MQCFPNHAISESDCNFKLSKAIVFLCTAPWQTDVTMRRIGCIVIITVPKEITPWLTRAQGYLKRVCQQSCPGCLHMNLPPEL